MIDIEQIILTSFTQRDNYSYKELLEYLNVLKKECLRIYDENRRLRDKSKIDDKTLIMLEDKINSLNKIIEQERDKNLYLICKINKKLTIFERIKGKIKI